MMLNYIGDGDLLTLAHLRICDSNVMPKVAIVDEKFRKNDLAEVVEWEFKLFLSKTKDLGLLMLSPKDR